MYRKTFHLKQHTPLIHFQYDQAGATLRATEVKPALDRYLLGNMEDPPFGWFNRNHRKRPRNKRTAMDYKLHFYPLAPYELREEISKNSRIPMFFGDLGERKTGLIKHDQLEGVISCTSSSLMDYIQTHLANFFKCHTFGMRSSKGYGSFSLEDAEDFAAATVQPRFSFLVTGRDWKQRFEKVDLFYKSVRGGVNGVFWSDREQANATKFYMKPMLWLYARANNKVWEKRYIKANAPNGFFPFQEQVGQHPNKRWQARDQTLTDQEGKNYGVPPPDRSNWPLWYKGTDANGEDTDFEEVIVRDLFGLSTNQTWRGYGRGRNPNASVNKTDTGNIGIQRSASPWVFKPEKEGQDLRVNVFVRPIEADFLRASFRITADGGRVGTLPVWPGFNMDEFIDNYLTPVNLRAAVQQNAPGYGNAEQTAFNTLLDIYQEVERTK